MPRKKSEEPKEPIPEVSVRSMSIVEEMRRSFIEYSMSVITSRALPDVRDGLKPVHRRILYSMHENNLYANAKFRKSATVVGAVIGSYHPHGDTSIYDAMVNIAQDFKYRYPLIIGQGNFGSLDGDRAAAYRYTEAKMSKISAELLSDIGKDTVDFRDNFDATKREPTVLPASVPNLLLNGVLGIAVGMATNIPTHNLREVIDATVHLLQHPEATNEDLMEFVQGPDFPLPATVYNRKDIIHAYSTGRGGVVTRGNAEIIENDSGKSEIIISSIPFRVNRSDLIIKIANHVHEKKLEGVKDLRDESSEETRIVIELKPGVSPQRVLNYVYKHTELETTFHYNMTALVDGVPQTLSLREILYHFVAHRKEVIIRRTRFDLAKAEARAHILEGLKKALDHIEEVIKTIRKSKHSGEAKLALMKQFKFTEIQAQAILEMRLQKLAGLERKEIEDELAEKLKLIKELKSLLASPEKIREVAREELEAIKEKYGDERRTKVIAHGVRSLSDEDLIIDKEATLVFTEGGYIKRTDASEYKSQKRGGQGVADLDTKDEDVITHLLAASTHSDILFFSDAGKVYSAKMYDIPEAKRTSRGKSIHNFLQLEETEKITSILAVPKDIRKQEGLSLLLCTKKGTIKKVAADSFKNVRKNGLIAITLKDDDILLSARIVSEKDEVVLVTYEGQSIRFKESDVREMGRNASGVKGITLKGKDNIVGVGIVQGGTKDARVLVITEKGYGKTTKADQYKTQSRGGSGIKTAQITAKTGAVVGARVVTPEDEEIIAISEKGQIIRMRIADISVLGRATQGVRLMKLRAGDSVASIAVIES